MLRLGRRIVSLDLDGHRATDDRGDEYGWEKCCSRPVAARAQSLGRTASFTTEPSTTTGPCVRRCTMVPVLS